MVVVDVVLYIFDRCICNVNNPLQSGVIYGFQVLEFSEVVVRFEHTDSAARICTCIYDRML